MARHGGDGGGERHQQRRHDDQRDEVGDLANERPRTRHAPDGVEAGLDLIDQLQRGEHQERETDETQVREVGVLDEVDQPLGGLTELDGATLPRPVGRGDRWRELVERRVDRVLDEVVVGAEPLGNREGEGQQRDQREDADVGQRGGPHEALVLDHPLPRQAENPRRPHPHLAKGRETADLDVPQILVEEPVGPVDQRLDPVGRVRSHAAKHTPTLTAPLPRRPRLPLPDTPFRRPLTHRESSSKQAGVTSVFGGGILGRVQPVQDDRLGGDPPRAGPRLGRVP